MKSGIRRKVDDLGRVVIPAGIRRSLGIREGDAVEVSVQGDEVVLSKPVDQCVFCRSEHELQTFRGKAICGSCAAGVGMLDAGAPAGGEAPESASDAPLAAWPGDRPDERRVADRDRRVRVVPREPSVPVERQELPASTTAW